MILIKQHPEARFSARSFFAGCISAADPSGARMPTTFFFVGAEGFVLVLVLVCL